MMNYTNKQLNNDIIKLNNEQLVPIRIDRGRRYGTEEDTLYNVREADWFEKDGWRGAFTSMLECKNRIQKYAKIPTKDFTAKQFLDMLDACYDQINYSFYILLMFEQKYEQTQELMRHPPRPTELAGPEPKVVPWESKDVVKSATSEP